jgi:hypothetical protein
LSNDADILASWPIPKIESPRLFAQVAVASPFGGDVARTIRAENTSISGLLAELIEALVGEDDAYEQAQRRALALLEQGFHLGGRLEVTRDEWHER